MKKQQSSNPQRKYISFVLFFFLLLCLLFITKQGYAKAIIATKISPIAIPLNHSAILTVTLTNAGNGKLNIPDIPGISLQQRGTSRQFSNINGNTTASITYSYILQGEKEGNYTLPPVTFSTSGETIESGSLNFTILPPQKVNNSQGNRPPIQPHQKSQTEQSNNIAEADLALLQVRLPEKTYSGENISIKIRALFNTDTKIQPGSITLPKVNGDGIIVEPFEAQPNQTREEYNGKIWDVLTWQVNISAVKQGAHPITIDMDATALITQNQTADQSQMRSPLESFFGRNNPFADPFFDQILKRYVEKPLHLNWKEMLTVQPLPTENRPENFNGAVGQFDLAVTTRAEEIEAGDPILLTIAVNGVGNFNKITLPTLPKKNGWKTYPPKIHFEPLGNSGGGQKIFEQAIVIANPQVKEIPSLSINYFDPEKKQYITKYSAPVPIRIIGKNDISTPTSAVTEQTEKKPDLLPIKSSSHPIKIEIGSLSKELHPLPQRPWFQRTVLVFVIFAILTILFQYRQKSRKKTAQELRKQAARRLREDLLTIQAAQKNGDKKLFLNATRVAIQNSLADRCDMHPSAISLTDLRKVLPHSSPLIKIFHQTDKASYGGETISSTELNELYAQLTSELENLI